MTSSAVGASGLAARLDAGKIGVAGHSLGGKVSINAAILDSRIKAVVGWDPVDALPPFGNDGSLSVAPELMGGLTVPIALLGETTDSSGGLGGMSCAPAADNFHQYYEHATHAAIEIEVMGASHMSFLDDPACGFTCSSCPAGTDDPATSRRLTRRYLTAFLNVTLRGLPAYRSYLIGADMAGDVAAGRVRAAAKNGL